MPDPSYQDITQVPAGEPVLAATTVLVVQGGNIKQLPAAAFIGTTIDRALTSPSDLEALSGDAATNDFKWFVNAARLALECWEFRADGHWHQIL